METRQAQRQQLKQDLLAYIQRGQGQFNDLALALFDYQHRHNDNLRAYCQRMGVSPGGVAHWGQLPTVPTDVFRYLPLFCGDPREARHVFRTSGTTSGARGQHFLRDLDLYHASARQQIERLLLPGGAGRPALMLAPPPEALPDSSLSSMLGLIAQEYSQDDATFAWSGQALDIEAALAWLDHAQGRAVPVQVLTTSFALLFVLDAMQERGLRVALPAGSTLMTTGGTKGRSRQVTTSELEVMACDLLGLSLDGMVHEYGMTELGSQLYDPRGWYKRQGQGSPPDPCFLGPAWCRVTAHDPETLAPVDQGQAGLLRFTDLSNLDSVCSLQTSDMGRVLRADSQGDLIQLQGRAPGATPRGCSLLIEEAQRVKP
jgi:hypothetical protein